MWPAICVSKLYTSFLFLTNSHLYLLFYRSRNTLEEHNNTHTGVRPYRCEICGKDFTSKYTFKAHEKVHTNRERNFTCINCGKAFLTEQNLIHHERTHSGLKNYVCQKCGMCK